MKRLLCVLLTLVLAFPCCSAISAAAADDGSEEEVYLLGDVDMDGLITANDALLILRCSLGLIGGEGLELRGADVDGDSVITANDALTVLRTALGISLPPNTKQ